VGEGIETAGSAFTVNDAAFPLTAEVMPFESVTATLIDANDPVPLGMHETVGTPLLEQPVGRLLQEYEYPPEPPLGAGLVKVTDWPRSTDDTLAVGDPETEGSV
jgi:hypothetical protein